ncbi:type I restriction-modification system, M subunit [Nitrosopumilus maritimus SCM1]|uniref:site-specific DNA-methyltransferase (adenine-specific) n=1 Tax=Nitrosopumilus maritimus (strain SCM1) TaxID=436308 RepID=A9A373_NITMS|nr:type I restriction-modification system, M subunit [Nitrosopumilus maritimus SCM1]
MLSDQKLTFEQLEQRLFDAADILRKHLDASENRKPVLTLLFLKRLNDIFEENVEKLMKDEGLSKKEAENKRRHPIFYLPEDTRWNKLQNVSEDVGSKIIEICKKIEDANQKKLGGTMMVSEFNIKEKYPDTALVKLIDHFSTTDEGYFRLRNSDLENEDIFGDAYEQLLEMFASETKKKGGQFYTPRKVVQLLVELMEPKYDYRINDPTCGSGGMLIHSRQYVEKSLKKEKKSSKEIEELLKNLTLHGQDSNIDTVNMCKMNMVIHGVPSFSIEWGDVLESPKFVKDGKLIEYDRVLANFPFSENWEASGKENDGYGRFKYGIAPAKDKADFAFILHMLSSLNENGKAAIVCSQGVLFRGSSEQKIRENMIAGNKDENLQGDMIEAIIALPVALFYGTGIPACVLILNKNKPKERKNKILFIYAANEFQEGKVRNKLRDKDIEHIVKAFKAFKDEDKYCHVAELDEIRENEFNLNVPRYVDISEEEKIIDIQATIDELKKLDKERDELELKVKQDLKELGFKV